MGRRALLLAFLIAVVAFGGSLFVLGPRDCAARAGPGMDVSSFWSEYETFAGLTVRYPYPDQMHFRSDSRVRP